MKFYILSQPLNIAKLTGTTTHATYDELKKASLRLKRREVWITEKPNGAGSHDVVLVTNWVQSIRYIKQEGRIELRFARDMLPYLSQFVEQFTTYALTDIAKMTSANAIRLYELMMQWKSKGVRQVSLDDLRKWLLIEDKYPLMADLRRWVIEPSVQQINEFSPINVTWSPKKTGRKVTHLTFEFTEKSKSKKVSKPRAKQVIKDITPPKAPSEQPTQPAGRTRKEKDTAATSISQILLNLGLPDDKVSEV